jgi:transcriptional regulator with XRE-family HTH domain
MNYSTKKYHAFRRYLGNNIRIHREDNGLSQEQLAEASDLEIEHVQHLEDAIGNPTFNAVFRIACALDIEPHMLIENIYAEDGKVCLSHFSIYD